MIESWMFDAVSAEVSYRTEQLKRARQAQTVGKSRRRRRNRAVKPVPRPVEVQPVDAADSRTKEKVSAG